MLRYAIIFFVAIFLFVPSSTYAAVVTVNNSGNVVWNVLPAYDEIGKQDNLESLKVTNVANTESASQNAKIALTNSEGRIQLTVNDSSGIKQADVSNVTNEIVEIEQVESPKKISIHVSGDGFLLRENDVQAYTSFPITIEPEEKKITVGTSSGSQYLSVLPSEALIQLYQSKVIDLLEGDHLIISDGELGEVQYTVHGKKILDILNVFEYQVPITANVSATNGEVLSVDQPFWLPIAAFLFV